LSSGVGLKVEMDILLESQSGGVSVTAVYDEGSAVGSVEPSVVRRMSTFFSDTNVYAALIALPGLAIVYAIFRLGLRRKERAHSINKLVFTLEYSHRKLEDDPYISERIYLYKWYDSVDPELLKSRHSKVRKIMKNPKDYIIIDDLNSKLENRNKKIENELEAIKNTSPEEYQHEVKKLNTKCLDQINKALSIEWENYY
jgi:hypothetical protein